MNIAYFDCFAGIAGDMVLAALIDCGVPLDELKKGLSSLPISGWNIEAEAVLREGIHAMNVRVTLDGISDDEELAAIQAHEKSHHDHEHNHNHNHSHEHDHHHHAHESTPDEHKHHHEHVHGRSMAEIREVIEASNLSTRVKETSLEIFGRIAVAEAYLHHSTPEEIHFHEIGGVDSLIDICGVAWCLEYLGVDEIHCSALPHSTGFVDCAHGRMPVPAPATLEILKDAQWTPTGLTGELVTPTGAGIVAALSRSFGEMPAMSPQKIGIGSGKKTLSDRPNLLRVVIGKASTKTKQSTPSLAGLTRDTLCVLECNIDDMNPEFYDGVVERLFAADALDVWMQPIQMKKNRPGVLLGALCEIGKRDEILNLILRETTSLGVRTREVLRFSLPRKTQTVQTEWGEVVVKIADWSEGELWRATPEYSDVARLSRKHNVSLRQVYQAAANAAENSRQKI